MVKNQQTILLLNDHLHRGYGALKEATPQSHSILFIESERMLATRKWHLQRLFFLMSTRDHFLADLKKEGFTVTFLQSTDTATGIKEYRSKNPNVTIIATEPSSHQQLQQFKELGITLIPNDFFLTSRPLFAEWASSQKSHWE